jgi:hypothetical protein
MSSVSLSDLMHIVEIFVIFSLIVYLYINPFHYAIHMLSALKKISHQLLVSPHPYQRNDREHDAVQ